MYFNLFSKNIKLTSKENLGKFLFILGLISLLFYTCLSFIKLGVWNDEYFSLAISKLGWSTLYTEVVNDVHPILYYLTLKSAFIFSDFVGFNNYVIVGHIVSLIPFYLLGLLALTKIRENFGMLTGGLFFFCICTMPYLMRYAIEIRMYSLALLLVTLALVYGYEISINKNIKKNWIILTIIALLGSYTHYFAALALVVVYLLLLIHILKNNYDLIKYWIISTLIICIFYIPGVSIGLYQMNHRLDVFWVPPVTINNIYTDLIYTFSPIIPKPDLYSQIVPCIFIVCFLMILLYSIYKQRKMFDSPDNRFAIACIVVFILVPTIGIIFSIIKNPIWMSRYLVEILGCLWIGFSLLVSKINNKKILLFIICFIVLTGAIGINEGIHAQTIKEINTENDYIFLENTIGSNNIVFCNSKSVYYVLFSELPNNSYYIHYGDPTKFIKEKLKEPNIQEKINDGSKIYYVESISQGKTDNLSYNLINSKKIAQNHYDIDVYLVKG